MEKMKDIPNDSVDLVVTDPPYGISYQSARRIDSERFEMLMNDDVIKTEWLTDAFMLKDGGAIYVFTRTDVYPEWVKAVSSAGFQVKSGIVVWDRIIHGMGDLDGAYSPCYDLIIFASKGRHILKGNRPKDVVRFKRIDAEKLVHPTQKPVDLIEFLIRNSSDVGHVVLDPFMGSGTTMVACQRLGRKRIGIELDEYYFKLSKGRIDNLPKKLGMFV